jgi:hypothetical protein
MYSLRPFFRAIEFYSRYTNAGSPNEPTHTDVVVSTCSEALAESDACPQPAEPLSVPQIARSLIDAEYTDDSMSPKVVQTTPVVLVFYDDDVDKKWRQHRRRRRDR